MTKASTPSQILAKQHSYASSLAMYVLALTLCGIVSGGVGAFMILFLRACVWVFFGVWNESFMVALQGANPTRRIFAVIIGAACASAIWAWLRRTESVLSVAGLLKATQHTGARLAPRRLLAMIACALVQVMAVGAGNSFGRENAPRQMAAAISYAITTKLRIDAQLARYAIAASAGAALAAVYNTPIAAIAFTAGVTLRQYSWKICASAAYVSIVATPIAWIVNDGAPSTPLRFPSAEQIVQQLAQISMLELVVLAILYVLVIVCGAAVGIVMRELCAGATRYAQRHYAVVSTRQQRALMMLTMLSAGTLTGCVGVIIPQLLGNGKNTLDILYGNATPIVAISLAVACGVLVLKPLLTAYSLRAGMIGGLLMPSASVGASLGCALCIVAQWFVPGFTLPIVPLIAAMALIGAACVLAVTQRSGIFATVFLIELAHVNMWMWLLVGIGVAGAVLLSRYIEQWLERQQPGPNPTK